MPNEKKFLDAAGVTHLVSILDDYPNNEILGTVIDSIQDEMDNLILIQTTQPTESDNKIWINNSSSNSSIMSHNFSSHLKLMLLVYSTSFVIIITLYYFFGIFSYFKQVLIMKLQYFCTCNQDYSF